MVESCRSTVGGESFFSIKGKHIEKDVVERWDKLRNGGKRVCDVIIY